MSGAGAQGGAAVPPVLLEHHFRREHARLVASLVRRVGASHLEAVEDAVQAALLAALAAWARGGVPSEPAAWLHRAARNHLLGALRRDASRQRLLLAAGLEDSGVPPEEPRFAGEVEDELLRMLFLCADEVVPPESRLVLALKTLCGLSVAEIAFRLFTTEANVYKRLSRARERLREAMPGTDTPPLDALRARLESVRAMLYLLFNEGYLSVHAEQAIRAEVCAEALRLTTLLAEHPVGAVPATFALLALMHLHAARLASRQDASGGLLLLEEQDRGSWDAEHLRAGALWLHRAADGDQLSRYHAEAGIAAEHCFSPSFAETRWSAIAELYAMLERIAPSPLYTLNRAVAVAEADGAAAALRILAGLTPPTWLDGHYLWAAVLADLHRRAGDEAPARAYREQALAAAPTAAVRAVLARRLAAGG